MVEIEGSGTSTSTNRLPSFQRNRIDYQLSVPTIDDGKIANQMATQLWASLPFSRLADEVGHRNIEQIVSVASSSHLQIVGWYTELPSLFEAILLASVEIRGDESVVARYRDRIAPGILDRETTDGSFSVPPKSFVDYQFADLSPDEAFNRAEQELERQCLKFVNDMFEFLDRLRKQQLVGKLDQVENNCRYSFYRRVAILDNPTVRQENRSSLNTIDTLEVTSADVQHRHAMHIHHVHDPVLRDINQTQHPLPEKYQRFLQSCPSWFQPHLRVLEGELFREQQIEWDTSNETLNDEKLIESREFKWSPDPAIVLGDYVLAGWGEHAISGEVTKLLEQQALVDRKIALGEAARYRIATLVFATLAILIMAFSLYATPLIVTLAILSGIIAMYTASLSVNLTQSDFDIRSSSQALWQSMAVGTSVFAVQSFLFCLLHWSVTGLILAATFLILAVGVSAFRPSHRE